MGFLGIFGGWAGVLLFSIDRCCYCDIQLYHEPPQLMNLVPSNHYIPTLPVRAMEFALVTLHMRASALLHLSKTMSVIPYSG
jgi:hypothetical protein